MDRFLFPNHDLVEKYLPEKYQNLIRAQLLYQGTTLGGASRTAVDSERATSTATCRQIQLPAFLPACHTCIRAIRQRRLRPVYRSVT